MRKSLLLLVVALAAVLGCQGEPPAIKEGTSAQPPKEQVQQAEEMNLASLEASYDEAEAAYKKSPDDKAAKEKYIEASNRLAYAIMMSDAPANKKYPQALGMYRTVLKIDPKNEEATKWVGEIEAIYESMGRPIPKT